MKHIWTRILSLLLLSSATALYAQTPTWQWGSSGGAASSSGPNGEDNVIDMATDPNGNVYVLANNNQGTGIKVDGQTVGIGPFDRISMAKWNCQGDLKWVKTFGGGATFIARAIDADSLGGIYITGLVGNTSSASGNAYFDIDTTLPYSNKLMYLVKYDTAGQFQWLKMPEDTVYGNIFDMAVSPGGQIYLECYLNQGSYDNGAFTITEPAGIYVLSYNAIGAFQDVTRLDITSNTFGNISFARFNRDHHSGRYYLAGYYDPNFGTLSFGNTTFPDTSKFYLAAFDNAGNSLWTKINTGNGTAGIFDRPAIDEQRNVYIGGQALPGDSFNGYVFTSSGAATMPFVIGVDSSGNIVLASHGITTNASVAVSALNYANNTIAATGGCSPFQWDSIQVTTPPGITYPFLTRINATNGAVIGLETIPANGLGALPSTITGDKNSNFYVGGSFTYQLFPDGDTLTNWGGASDWFVAKFGSANCNCDIPQPNFSYNTTGSNTYAFNYTGSTPYTGISWDFGDGAPASSGNANPVHTYAASGTYHVCVTVTNNCGSNTYCKTINIDGTGIQGIPGFANILIYPNPATQEIVIEQAAAGTALDIYNVTGSRLLHRVLKGSKDRINVGNLPSGIYLMRFRDKEGHQGSHKFVKR